MQSILSFALFLTIVTSSVIERRCDNHTDSESSTDTASNSTSSSPSGSTSNSWAGSNNYYLHALQPEEQATYINGLKGFGAKVVRLWVTGGQDGCTKSSSTKNIPVYESELGKYDTTVLAALDSVLKQLHDAGIKAIISPHDANNLPPSGQSTGYNGIDIYGSTYQSSDNFYSSSDAKTKYDARIASILNYESPAFGTKWANLSEAILAFDLQNEPMIASVGKLQNNDPDDWICGRAGAMKSIIGDSGVKISTGGIGGSQYSPDHEFNNLAKALACDAIDMIAMHGYMSQASQWANYVPKVADQAQSSNKHLYIEEWGVGTDPSMDSITKQAAVFNNAGVPWLYWQITPGPSIDQSCDSSNQCCHQSESSDPKQDYEVGMGSSRAGNGWGSLMGESGAAGKEGRQGWGGFVY